MFVEIGSSDELVNFINENETCLVTFSATWCGPCKASKPTLRDEIAAKSTLNFGYVHEDDLDSDFFDVFIEIKSFPTYVIFKDGREAQRVEGTDFDGLQKMLDAHSS